MTEQWQYQRVSLTPVPPPQLKLQWQWIFPRRCPADILVWLSPQSLPSHSWVVLGWREFDWHKTWVQVSHADSDSRGYSLFHVPNIHCAQHCSFLWDPQSNHHFLKVLERCFLRFSPSFLATSRYLLPPRIRPHHRELAGTLSSYWDTCCNIGTISLCWSGPVLSKL